MVHELVHTAWAWAVIQFNLTPWEQDDPWKWNVIGLLVIAVGLSMLLYHFVEEHARHWMRRMVDVGRLNTDAPAHSAGGKLQSIDGAVEARPKSISVRAG